jgi:hypothetical protein
LVPIPKRQKSPIGDVIPRRVKEEEESKVGIKDKVDIKDEASSEDDVFCPLDDIQVDNGGAKRTASGAKKTNHSERKNKS